MHEPALAPILGITLLDVLNRRLRTAMGAYGESDTR